MINIKSNRSKVTIALLTRNSSKTIRGVLEGIVMQKFKDYEILVIDSSSTDDTVSIVKKFHCKVLSIKSEDFGHGKTRNYAVQQAKGEFVVFLTHDSVPRKNNWLEEIIKPFVDNDVVGVYGRQVPRTEENILDKYFQMSLYGEQKITWACSNWRQGDNLFSDANSAVRRATLLEHPYADNIIVSEDYEWAARILKIGLKIVYSPSAQATHSHSYNIYTLFKRNFDVGVSYKKIYTSSESRAFIGRGLKVMANEIGYLNQSGHTALIPFALFRNAVRFVAIQLGNHEQVFSVSFKRKYLSAQGWYWK